MSHQGMTVMDVPAVFRSSHAIAATPPMVLVPAAPQEPGGPWRRLADGARDVALVLVLGALFPFAILAVGTPIALVVLALLEIVGRF